MNQFLQEPVSVLCDEVGVPVPEPDEHGQYRILIDDQEVRVFTQGRDKSVMLGVICHAESAAENRQESLQTLLSECLAIAAGRFRKFGKREVLSLEPESGELILWVPVDDSPNSIPSFLAKATSLLNELEFWKRWLANT